MSGLGKKILSAFVEVTEDPKPVNSEQVTSEPAGATPNSATAAVHQPTASQTTEPTGNTAPQASSADGRFQAYFDKLFSEANIPGPDYYEFSKMTEAMMAIPDERSRFIAAFAGLQVQGLDKKRLLSTATDYLKVLDGDTDKFMATAQAAVEAKVNDPKKVAEEKGKRIEALAREIKELQDQIIDLQRTIQDNEARISASTAGYNAEAGVRKARITTDIEKIKQYLSQS